MSGLQLQANSSNKRKAQSTLGLFGFETSSVARIRTNNFGHTECSYCSKWLSPQGLQAHLDWHKRQGHALKNTRPRGLSSGAVAAPRSVAASSSRASAVAGEDVTEKQCLYCGYFIKIEQDAEDEILQQRFKSHVEWHQSHAHKWMEKSQLKDTGKLKVIIDGPMYSAFANQYSMVKAAELVKQERMRCIATGSRPETLFFTTVADHSDLQQNDPDETGSEDEPVNVVAPESFDEGGEASSDESFHSDDESSSHGGKEDGDLSDDLEADVGLDNKEARHLVADATTKIAVKKPPDVGADGNPVTHNRKQRNFTIGEKREILAEYTRQQKHLGPEAVGAKAATVRWVQQKFARPSFSRQSLNCIIKRSHEILKETNQKKKETGVKNRDGHYPLMEYELYEWIMEMRCIGLPVETKLFKNVRDFHLSARVFQLSDDNDETYGVCPPTAVFNRDQVPIALCSSHARSVDTTGLAVIHSSLDTDDKRFCTLNLVIPMRVLPGKENLPKPHLIFRGKNRPGEEWADQDEVAKWDKRVHVSFQNKAWCAFLQSLFLNLVP